jgi:methylated-DNA-[protein]-cysteine S-methyltransferase
MRYTFVDSPIGTLLLAGTDAGLCVLGLPEGKRRPVPAVDWTREDGAFAEARQQLASYFDGRLRAFSLPLDPRGTAFQLRVWRALQQIPYGDTLSYGELAARIGQPSAGRAVGLANGRNPLPIVVPCHRVIGRDGTLTGYGGGLGAKRFLLDLERRTAGTGAALPFA